jgi:hypothetical protein
MVAAIRQVLDDLPEPFDRCHILPHSEHLVVKSSPQELRF